MRLENKFLRLKKIIRGYGSCLIAFSGGADSAFLLKSASLVLPKNKLLAVTACSATYPEDELRRARELAAAMGVRHKVIRSAELEDENFTRNSRQRCYFCKKELFSKLKHTALRYGLRQVLEATTLSDKEDFRPGNMAKKESGVKSPLARAGLKKEDIRILSKGLKLASWNKPSSACLASRIPYGTKITHPLLRRIEKAEQYLRRLGFVQLRARHHDALCRIEVEKEALPAILAKRKKIVDRLKRLGYRYVALDLEGYRTGSLNEVIKI